MKGTGVPYTFRKCNADQAVTASPTNISSIDTGRLAPSGKIRGRLSNLSTKIAAITNSAVNTPKIVRPIGVKSVRVFWVPVAALLRRLIQCLRKVILVSSFRDSALLSKGVVEVKLSEKILSISLAQFVPDTFMYQIEKYLPKNTTCRYHNRMWNILDIPLNPASGLSSDYIRSPQLCILDFPARNKTPLVLGELLKPVSPTSSGFSKPIFSNKARKSTPGIVPPSH